MSRWYSSTQNCRGQAQPEEGRDQRGIGLHEASRGDAGWHRASIRQQGAENSTGGQRVLYAGTVLLRPGRRGRDPSPRGTAGRAGWSAAGSTACPARPSAPPGLERGRGRGWSQVGQLAPGHRRGQPAFICDPGQRRGLLQASCTSDGGGAAGLRGLLPLPMDHRADRLKSRCRRSMCDSWQAAQRHSSRWVTTWAGGQVCVGGGMAGHGKGRPMGKPTARCAVAAWASRDALLQPNSTAGCLATSSPLQLTRSYDSPTSA